MTRTREIPIHNSDLTVTVDAADFGWLSKFTWCIDGGYAFRCARVRVPSATYLSSFRPRFKSVKIWMHREIMKAPEGLLVDHRDGNRLNNTRRNLRLATRAQNAQNAARRCDNRSGYIGVSFYRGSGKWGAGIQHNKAHVFVGLFDTAEEAARARDAAAVAVRGDFIRLNFPGERIAPAAPRPRRGKTSKYRGVSRREFHSQRAGTDIWQARIQITRAGKKRSIYLGVFADEVDAAKAYDRAAIKHLGSAAALNFGVPDDSPEPARLSRKTSRYRGVGWNARRRKWQAILSGRIEGRRIVKYLGLYSDELEAAKAYDRAALAHLGSDARLNFARQIEERETQRA